MYPDKFIFNKETDNKGNSYKKAYSNKLIPCIICINGKNILVNGRFNLFERKGNSKFGDEIGIYFKIEEKVKEYLTSSSHEVVEFYLPKEIALDFLKNSIKHFEDEK